MTYSVVFQVYSKVIQLFFFRLFSIIVRTVNLMFCFFFFNHNKKKVRNANCQLNLATERSFGTSARIWFSGGWRVSPLEAVEEGLAAEEMEIM